jgi:hypothetical protein
MIKTLIVLLISLNIFATGGVGGSGGGSTTGTDSLFGTTDVDKVEESANHTLVFALNFFNKLPESAQWKDILKLNVDFEDDKIDFRGMKYSVFKTCVDGDQLRTKTGQLELVQPIEAETYDYVCESGQFERCAVRKVVKRHELSRKIKIYKNKNFLDDGHKVDPKKKFIQTKKYDIPYCR